MAVMCACWYIYLDSSLSEDFVLFQDAVKVVVVGDFEEGDSFDWGHFGYLYIYNDRSTVNEYQHDI